MAHRHYVNYLPLMIAGPALVSMALSACGSSGAEPARDGDDGEAEAGGVGDAAPAVRDSAPAEALCRQDERLCNRVCGGEISSPEPLWLSPDPPSGDDPITFAGEVVTVEAAAGTRSRRFVLEAPDGMRQAFAYDAPEDTLVSAYVVVGSRLRVDVVVGGAPGGSHDRMATITELPSADFPDDGEFLAFAFVEHRGSEPFAINGYPFQLVDLGCAANLIGDCIQAAPAALVSNPQGDPDSFEAGRSLEVLATGDDTRIYRPADIHQWMIHIGNVFRDEDACDPTEHGLHATFLLYPSEH